MAYDSDISSEVSLSRVLDEMLVDGTPDEIVLSFLKSHKKSLVDIYRHSTMVFQLYDVSRNGWIDDFLIDNIHLLPDHECFYAAANVMFWLRENDRPKDVTKVRIACSPVFAKYKPSRAFLCGTTYDLSIILGEYGSFSELFASFNDDVNDISHFINCSYVLRSAMMYYNFKKLSPSTQYMIMNVMVNAIAKCVSYSFSSLYVDKMNRGAMLGDIVLSLLRQTLYMNDIELFNWIVRLFNINLHGMREMMANCMYEYMPTSISHALRHATMGIDEIVFEMNMLVTQFDPMDLFIYVYVIDNGMLGTLRENQDLIDFFNLPFDWNELEKLKAD